MTTDEAYPIAVPTNLQSTEPGHRITGAVKRSAYPGSTYHKIDLQCVCGKEFSAGYLTQDGRPKSISSKGLANSYLARAWNGHVQAAADAGLVIAVGSIQMHNRVKHISVMTGPDATANGFTNKRSWYSGSAWVVCVETVTKTTNSKKVEHGYADKPDALWKGEDVLLKAERSGRQVTYLRESTIKESSEGTTFRFLELADRAIESRSLHDIEAAREELDQFFKLLPIIEGKRDVIEALRNELLLGWGADDVADDQVA